LKVNALGPLKFQQQVENDNRAGIDYFRPKRSVKEVRKSCREPSQRHIVLMPQNLGSGVPKGGGTSANPRRKSLQKIESQKHFAI
jgi:hypothetical protein